MPRELRFLTDPGGLLDLVFGTRSRIDGLVASNWRSHIQKFRRAGLRAAFPPTPDRFLVDLQGKWWLRSGPQGEARGLHKGIDLANFMSALRNFEARYPTEREAAALRLVDEVMSPATLKQNCLRWADTTPQNAENAHRLVRLNPAAKVVFMIRDGRDTCASILSKPWGPVQPMEALEWWRSQALRAHVSIQRTDPRSAITILFDDLVAHDRNRQLSRLFDHLELDVTTDVEHFFNTRVTPERAHIGRWKYEIPESIQSIFVQRYQQIHREFQSAGLVLPPIV